MPWPTTYTESSLAEHLVFVLGSVAVDLNLTAVDLQPAVNDALEDYGVSDIAEAADGKKLRALASYRAWKWVVEQYIPQYAYTTDGESRQRQQKVEAAAAYGLGQARVEAARYGVGSGALRVDRVVNIHDPYAPAACAPEAWP